MQNRQEVIFDKYTVRSKAELAGLHAAHSLAGSYMITGDTKHVGIHKYFYYGQKFKHWLRRDLSKTKPDSNLCHNMICVGWDDAKQRPILAHIVMDGLKINATCYFTYDDKDVNYIDVYIPKDHTLKAELLHNADQTAAISTHPSLRSPFSWKQGIISIFKKPDNKAKRDIAVAMADLFLNGPLMDSENKKLNSFHCAHYAMRMMQMSMLLQSLNDKTRLHYCKQYHSLDRRDLIKTLLAELSDGTTKLGSAYAKSELCKVDPSCITSSDVGYTLNKMSDCHGSFFRRNASRRANRSYLVLERTVFDTSDDTGDAMSLI